MRLPYINLRWVAATVVVLLLVAGAAGSWLWWSGRPDKLWESARDYYKQGEKIRGVGNPTPPKLSDDDKARARNAYEHARTQVDLFIQRAKNDPRMAEARMLQFKVLWPLAGLSTKPEEAAAFQGEAFRAGREAANIDDKNIEAQAVMVFENFRRNDFRGAYPYARTLIDNLSAEKEKQVELDDFNDYVIGAYYVVALRDLQLNHPDESIAELEAGLAREKPGPDGKRQLRWRAVWIEVQALQKKAELAGRDTKALKAADDRLKTVLAQSADRARAELNETAPAADGKPEMPRLATLSVTNCDGLINTLLTGVLKADSHQATSERAQVLLDVCEKLANTPGAAPHIYQEAVRGSSRLAAMNGALPQGSRLSPPEMTQVQARAVAVNDIVLKNGGPIDPTAYLEMSRTAAQQGDRKRALDMAKLGLKVAAEQHNPTIPANDNRVVALESQAAWLLLLDHKVKEADEYLSLIAKQQKLKEDVAYMRGLGAVLDGRLEEGVQQLSVAATAARFKESMPLLLALSHAYMGMGQLDNAAPVLEDVVRIRKAQESKNRDDEPWINTWQPTLQHASLDLLRCYLALALKANAKADVQNYQRRAADLFKELQPTFLANDAQAAMLNYDLARLRMLEAKDPNGIEADVLRGQLTKTINNLPATAQSDPRVIGAQLNLILTQKETNPAVIAGAIAGTLGAPTDLAVRLGEIGRLRAGSAWQWHKAEEFLMDAAAKQKDSVGIQLAWVGWLVGSGRNQEALAKLNELEDKAATEKEKTRVQAYRYQLLVTAGKKDEADQILSDLRGSKGGAETADLLDLWAKTRSGDPGVDAAIDQYLTKYDQKGLEYYRRGMQAQVKGDFVPAIQSYERSMEFTQFKARSEGAILACVLGIQNGPPGKPDKANPEAALKEARRLRQAHPRSAGVLLAFCAAARAMDEVYGDDGMEGAVAQLMSLLGEEKTTAPAGPYVAAQQWVAAGRPDIARQLVKGNKKHLPSMVLATELAVADEDWAEAADDLKVVATLQPEAIDLPLWRAAIHEARGETKEAREIYEKFIADNPKLNTGYLAMARLHERAHEYKEALAWVKKWRDQMPDEMHGINALIRVLAEDGQAAEATKEADAFIKDQVAKANKAREEWEAKNPIKEKDEAKAKEEAENRAKVRQALPDTLALTLSLGFVNVFQQAKAFGEAEKWLNERAVPLLDKLPEDAKKANRDSLTMVRATIEMSRARQMKEKDPERARLMDLAIKGYDEVYRDRPGDLVSGNNLAWLLVKEKGQPTRAVALVDEVRKGRYSRKPITPERLNVEFLDTLGTVYHEAGLNQESLELFKQATDKRYEKEPRLFMYLALAQAGLKRKAEAIATLNKVINLADAQAKATPDPERKDRLAKLAQEARAEQTKIGIK